ncbi:acyl-CoA dehydratase activase [Halonatronum saccharophilum]|uniref:acyl-CoA dehydratase activase n=1 Tax=Halonatronum saccharophilum TaxID=150060 RepID=UPI00047FDD28|nr:acyl-CoA dehydratase activase [Halonatronum saccharophilum]
MKILGIDLGSREVKMALMDNGEVIAKEKVSTMAFYRDYSKYEGRIVVDTKRFNWGDIDYRFSTGYGRNNTDLKGFEAINEIKAHVYGALYQTGFKDFVLLDVGGQDVKVVRVEKGLTTDLELNDKCAASCGRYLENMANLLEISLDDMAKHFEDPVDLNSTCAVFSESELIGQIAQGTTVERLCAGVNYSMYKRLRPLLTKFKGNKLLLAGGVAHNGAILKYLEKDYDRVIKLDDPQFNGAIGCCYYSKLKINN